MADRRKREHNAVPISPLPIPPTPDSRLRTSSFTLYPSHVTLLILPFCLFTFTFCLSLAACTDAPPVPHAASAVDSMARAYLRTVASGNIDSIRLPLSAEGKERVTSLSIERTVGIFRDGPPAEVRLVDAEVADSYRPTVAERHRLIYRLAFPEERIYYYFFELFIERGDSTITGFRIDPREETEPRPESPSESPAPPLAR